LPNFLGSRSSEIFIYSIGPRVDYTWGSFFVSKLSSTVLKGVRMVTEFGTRDPIPKIPLYDLLTLYSAPIRPSFSKATSLPSSWIICYKSVTKIFKYVRKWHKSVTNVSQMCHKCVTKIINRLPKTFYEPFDLLKWKMCYCILSFKLGPNWLI